MHFPVDHLYVFHIQSLYCYGLWRNSFTISQDYLHKLFSIIFQFCLLLSVLPGCCSHHIISLGLFRFRCFLWNRVLHQNLVDLPRYKCMNLYSVINFWRPAACVASLLMLEDLANLRIYTLFHSQIFQINVPYSAQYDR